MNEQRKPNEGQETSDDFFTALVRDYAMKVKFFTGSSGELYDSLEEQAESVLSVNHEITIRGSSDWPTTIAEMDAKLAAIAPYLQEHYDIDCHSGPRNALGLSWVIRMSDQEETRGTWAEEESEARREQDRRDRFYAAALTGILNGSILEQIMSMPFLRKGMGKTEEEMGDFVVKSVAVAARSYGDTMFEVADMSEINPEIVSQFVAGSLLAEITEEEKDLP